MKTLIKILTFIFIGVILCAFVSDDKIPNGWHKAGSNPNAYRIGIDNQFSNQGQKSAFIESIDKQSSGFCTLMQSFRNNDYINKRIKMTSYVKTEGTIDTARMWVRIDDFDQKIADDFDNMDDRPITGTNDWKKCEIIFDVPSSKCTILFGMILSGDGKIWLDNVSFEIVDKSTKKTASSLNRPLPPNYIQRDNLGLFLNLDFEE